jgi:hypothetical protein
MPMNSWAKKFRRHFPGIGYISGDGPYAVVLPCGEATVQLFLTLEEAQECFAENTDDPCGSRCGETPEVRASRHFMVDLRQKTKVLLAIKSEQLWWYYQT